MLPVPGFVGLNVAHNRGKKSGPYCSDPGTRIHCCRCSLPGLTGFTISRRGETSTGHRRACYHNTRNRKSQVTLEMQVQTRFSRAVLPRCEYAILLFPFTSKQFLVHGEKSSDHR